MKTFVGIIALVAASVSAAPLGSKVASSPALQSASRDVTPLTLLTGPNLTSPANAPRAGAAIEFVPATQVQTAAPRASFVPGNATPGGTLTLSSESPDKIHVPAPPHRKPSPESLRFENTLHSPAAPPQMKFMPAPKRD